MRCLLLALLLAAQAVATPFPRIPPRLPLNDDQAVAYLENLRAKTAAELEINRRAAKILSEFTGKPTDPFFAFWIDEEQRAINSIDDAISLIRFGHIVWKQ